MEPSTQLSYWRSDMTVHGVDYSHWQNPPNTSYPPNVALMRQSGIQFVIIKAWEADSPDPAFKENWAALQDEAMPSAAYVWLHATDHISRMQACFDYLEGATLLGLGTRGSAHLDSKRMDGSIRGDFQSAGLSLLWSLPSR